MRDDSADLLLEERTRSLITIDVEEEQAEQREINRWTESKLPPARVVVLARRPRALLFASVSVALALSLLALITYRRFAEDARRRDVSAPDYFSVEGPSWSPDGQEIICAVGRAEVNRSLMGIVAVRLADGVERWLTPRRWDFIGQVAYMRDGSGVLMDAWDSAASLLARQIWQLSTADGTARRVTNDLNSYHGLSLTADASALVSVRATRATNFWRAPGDAPDRAQQITSGTGDLVGEVMGVAWTPDGRIVYGSNASGDLDVWVMDADGRNQRQLNVAAQPDYKPTVSPDGRFVVFVSCAQVRRTSDAWILTGRTSSD